jgi:hypothetical protein
MATAYPDLCNDPFFAGAYAMTISVGMALYLPPGAVSSCPPCILDIVSYPVELDMRIQENEPDGPIALDYQGVPRERIIAGGVVVQEQGDVFMGTVIVPESGVMPRYFWSVDGFYHNIYPMLFISVLAYMTADVYVPPPQPPPVVPPVDPPRFPPCGPAQQATVAGGPMSSGVVAL